jgi:hypothetical protein
MGPWDGRGAHSRILCMSIPGDILRMHLDYTAWASGRLMETATALPPEDLRRDFGTADKTLMGTLVLFSARIVSGWCAYRAKRPAAAWGGIP